MEPRRALAQAVALGGVLFALACSPAPLAAPQQRIAVTPWYTCAIEDDGAVVCWGDDESIALARPGFAAVTAPLRRLAIDQGDICAATDEGRVYCWIDFVPASEVVGVTGAIDLAIGSRDSEIRSREACAALGDGRVSCWPLYPPWRGEFVAGVRDAVQVARGLPGTCARRRDGAVWCWNDGPARPLPGVADAVDIAVADSIWVVHADGTVDEFDRVDPYTPPNRVKRLHDAVDVEAFASDACARRLDGGVSCWSASPADKSALYERPRRELRAVRVPGVKQTAELHMVEDTACVRDRHGALFCWGDNAHHRLGDAEGSQRVAAPRRITGLPAMTHVRVGSTHACAWDDAGDLWCWGERSASEHTPERGWVPPRRVADGNRRALLGTGVTCSEQSPGGFVCAGEGGSWMFEPGADFELRLAADTTSLDFAASWGCGAGPRGVECFGDAGYVRPGEPEYLAEGRRRVHPIPLPAPGPPVSVAVGSVHACVLMPAGAVLCWGDNRNAQLGRAAPRERATADLAVPVRVPDLPPMKRLSAGGSHTCGLAADGEAWCWGGQHEQIVRDGRTQDDTDAPIHTPRRVLGAPPLVRLESGSELDCGLALDGAVWCWTTPNAPLDAGDAAPPVDPPKRVAGLADVVDLHVAGDTVCAVDRPGQVWCWGGNDDGQADPSSPARSRRPVPVAPARRVTVKPASRR